MLVLSLHESPNHTILVSSSYRQISIPGSPPHCTTPGGQCQLICLPNMISPGLGNLTYIGPSRFDLYISLELLHNVISSCVNLFAVGAAPTSPSAPTAPTATTTQPSLQPTPISCTEKPTSVPTAAPTQTPTPKPTTTPTLAPTSTPSQSPTTSTPACRRGAPCGAV